jgi:hypothetical protein
MDVHAHTHTARRKWTHYFWEFSMLFLAVFCGFLAEYQLEHKIEKDREKQFIKTYIEDLKSDTASIRPVILARNSKIKRLDSFMLLLRQQKIKGYENELYTFSRWIIRHLTFRSNDRTISQLKYSGSLRLIRNEEAVDSIMSYQQLVELINISQNSEQAEMKDAYPLIARMFSAFVYDDMVTPNGIKRPTGNPPLRSYDAELQQDMAFYVHQLKGTSLILEPRLQQVKKKAISVILFLKSEYNLD